MIQYDTSSRVALLPDWACARNSTETAEVGS